MKFFRHAVLACLVVFWSTGAYALSIRVLDPIKGASTWFVEDHTVPIIAMRVSLPAGSVYDPPGKSGLATFAASMLDEGAAGLDSKAFHEALADHAINLTVDTDRDYLSVTLMCQSADVGHAFQLLALALRHPRIDPDAVARVRAQLLQNIEEEAEDPSEVATKTFYASYFAGDPYGRSPDGDRSGINAIGSQDIRSFVRSHWVNAGLKIAIAGDSNAAVVSSLLAGAFAGLPAAAPATVPPVGKRVRSAIRVVEMDVPQPHVVFGLPAVGRSDRDYIASYVANDILGGGEFSSRLMDGIRVERGLAYDISTELSSYRRASLIAGDFATRREKVGQAISTLREIVGKFWAEGATAQELADAKTYLTGSFPLAFTSNADIAAQLATYQQQGLDAGYVGRRNGLIDTVSLADIRRVAKRLFDPARLTVVVAGTGGKALAGTKH